MSDHDAAPDPVDKAYVQAEAVLDDEAARAARRARVLGAVARDTQAPAPAVSPPSRSRLSWRRGGWLAAACVAGLGALLAVRLSPPIIAPPEAPPAQPPVAAAPAEATAPPQPIPTAPAVRARPPVPAKVVATPFPRAEAPAPLARPAPPPPAAPPAPASADASADAAADEVAVTGSRLAPPPSAAAKAASGAGEAVAPADRAARLRAAAGAGRVAELTALLDQGAPVDAADDDGETALMKAVRADRPAAAALLRRHGANLERKNRAGASARDMAAAIGDPALDRALGLVR